MSFTRQLIATPHRDAEQTSHVMVLLQLDKESEKVLSKEAARLILTCCGCVLCMMFSDAESKSDRAPEIPAQHFG